MHDYIGVYTGYVRLCAAMHSYAALCNPYISATYPYIGVQNPTVLQSSISPYVAIYWNIRLAKCLSRF